MKNALRNSKGFSLIEMMIVVAVIGILAAVAIPQFSSFKNGATLATQKVDVKNIHKACEMYYNDHGKYTLKLSELKDYGFNEVSNSNLAILCSSNIHKHIKVIVGNSKTFKTVAFDSLTGLTTIHKMMG